MAIKGEKIDELLKDYTKPEDLVGSDGFIKELTKRIVDMIMDRSAQR